MTIAQNLGLLAPRVSNTGTISYTDLTSKPVVISLKGTSITYPGDDLAADPAGGQTLTINGTGFEATPTVYVGGTIASSVTFVSSTQITFVAPAKTAGTYDVYIVNPGGATAIMVFGISYSGVPAWTTAAGNLGTFDVPISVQLQATSNSAVSYALASGSTLPAGFSLSSSGLLSGTTSNDQTFSFTVTAIDAENQDTNRSFQVTVSTGDPLFKHNILLVTGNGTNATQNNSFVDSGPIGYTINRSGNAAQGTFTPYGSNWSNYFDGNQAYLATASNAAYQFGTGDFTIECWINMAAGTSVTSFWRSFVSVCGDAATGNGVTLYIGDAASGSSVAGEVAVIMGPDNIRIFGGQDVRGLGWVHVALARSGTTLRLFVNGVQRSSVTNSSNINGTSYGAQIGVSSTPNTNYFIGYISNVRVVKGTAVYTSNFSPSTTPLTAISGTSLLTCQSNRFVDNSASPLTITTTGSPVIQRFSPFSPSTAYSTATFGGSAYFDGSGDYLTAPNAPANFGSNNFTIECWVWFNTNSIGYQPIIMNAGTGDYQGWVFFLETNNRITWGCSYDGSNWSNAGLQTPSPPTINCWTHLAAVRNNGTVTIYVNGQGVSSNSAIGSNTIHAPSGALNIARYPYFPGGERTLNGYISNVRLVNGTAVYTNNFTPPTAPVTSITNTTLLLNMANAAIIDNSMINNLETIGSAQINTSVVKYGTGSVFINGTNNYIATAAKPSLNLSSNNFTMEAWIYPTSTGSYPVIAAQYGSGGNQFFWSMGNNNTNLEFYWYAATGGGGSIVATSAVTLNTWQHVAAVRSGNTITLYVNGTSVNSLSINATLNAVSTPLTIGSDATGQAYPFIGYIDDLRITNGVARYTANFTPPTIAHKLK